MIFWINVSDWIAHEENILILVHLNTMPFQNSLGQRVMLNESEVSGELLPFHFANHVILILWLFFWCDSLGSKQLRESCAPPTHPERCKPVMTSRKPLWYPRKHHAQLSTWCFSLLAGISNPSLAWPQPENLLLSPTADKCTAGTGRNSVHSERLGRLLQDLKIHMIVRGGFTITVTKASKNTDS